jgi:two-component system sensor histidine kinase EvgS
MGHGETILLVEDETAILQLGKSMLESLGYTVLAAAGAGESIALAQKHAGAIRLLITDVVLPEMNGWDLSQKLQAVYPDIRVLFMSGYTANALAHHGVLDKGVHFIQKPFSRQELAAKVHKALVNDTIDAGDNP